MRCDMLMIVAASLLLAAAAPEDAAQKELDKLQGTWTMEALEIDGKLTPPAQLGKTILLIKGDKYITKVGDKSYETTIKLDPSQNPRTLDMTFAEGANKDKVGKGIYQLDGDTFKLCRALEAGRERPTEFGTWPNTGVFLVTWKRQAP